MKSDIGNRKIPSVTSIIIYIIIFFVIWIITQWIVIKITYQPIFKWWDNTGGKNYNNLLNLNQVMAAYYSAPVYSISKIFTNPMASLNLHKIRFLVGELFPYQTYILNGQQNGILTPKSLCETVLLSPGDGDVLFDDWFANSAIIYGEKQSTSVNLEFTKSNGTTKNGITTFTFTPKKVIDPIDNTNKYGIYPASGDNEGWMGMIQTWCGSGWGWSVDANGLLVPMPINGDMENSLDTWYENKTGRGDNFFARMGINPDAPIIVYFCNNKWSTGGMKVDATAMLNLLSPSGPNAGGWIGFLNGMGDDVSFDDYRNYIRTHVDWRPPPVPPHCGKGTKTRNGIFGALSTALPLFGFAIATGGMGGIAIAGGAVVAGGISGFNASSRKC